MTETVDPGAIGGLSLCVGDRFSSRQFGGGGGGGGYEYEIFLLIISACGLKERKCGRCVGGFEVDARTRAAILQMSRV